MKLFHEREQYKGYNIYSMKKYVDKKRIAFNITIGVLIAITLIFVIYYCIDTTKRIKNSKQFEKQIIEYAQNQEEKDKQEEAKKAKIPNLTDEGKQNIKNIYHSENKRAFLTFDDGPSTNTNDILDILKEKNIKATFFVLGTQAEKMPETLIKSIILLKFFYYTIIFFTIFYIIIFLQKTNYLSKKHNINTYYTKLPKLNTFYFIF